MNKLTAASVRLALWRDQQTPPGELPLSQTASAKGAGFAQPTWRAWEEHGAVADIKSALRLKAYTGGVVHPPDFVRPPDPRDSDLSQDVSDLREQAAQQPAAGAA